MKKVIFMAIAVGMLTACTEKKQNADIPLCPTASGALQHNGCSVEVQGGIGCSIERYRMVCSEASDGVQRGIGRRAAKHRTARSKAS